MASRRAEIERIQKAIDQLASGGGGLDRQDRILAQWRFETDSETDRDVPEPDGTGSGENDAASGRAIVPEAAEDGQTRISTGCDAVDEILGGGLIRHGMHEWIGGPFPVSGKSGTPGWVPCLGPVIGVLHRLRNMHDDRGRPAPGIAWIGRRCRPGPWNLVASRDDRRVDETGASAFDHATAETLREVPERFDARLIDRSLFVLPAGDDRASRRWCLESAIQTPSLDAVVVDGAAFDPRDSRRIHLGLLERRHRGDPPLLVMMVRPPNDVRIRSAASTRWSITPIGTERRSFDGRPKSRRDSRRWRLHLLRCRMPQATPAVEEGIVGIVSDDWPSENPSEGRRPEERRSHAIPFQRKTDASKVRLDQDAASPRGSREASAADADEAGNGGPDRSPECRFERQDGSDARGPSRRPGWIRPGGRPAAQRPTGDRLLFEFGGDGDPKHDDAHGSPCDPGLESVERLVSGVAGAVACDTPA